MQYLITQTLKTDTRKNAKMIDPEKHQQIIDPRKSWFQQGQHQGVPIGNLTSQFGSNLYLNQWDHYIQRSLKPMHYQRYMDDLLLLDTDPARLEKMIAPINEWLLKNRNQKLNPLKSKLISLKKGIHYLGYFLKQVNEPADPLIILFPKNKKWNLVCAAQKLKVHNLSPVQSPHPLGRFSRKKARKNIASLNSHLGLAQKGKTYLFRINVLTLLEYELTENQDEPLDLTEPWCPLQVSKKYRSVKVR